MSGLTTGTVLLIASALVACGDGATTPHPISTTLYLGYVEAPGGGPPPFIYLTGGMVHKAIVSDSIVLYANDTYYRNLIRDSIITPVCSSGGATLCAAPDTIVISEAEIGTYLSVGDVSTPGSVFVLTNASDRSTYTGIVKFANVLVLSATGWTPDPTVPDTLLYGISKGQFAPHCEFCDCVPTVGTVCPG